MELTLGEAVIQVMDVREAWAIAIGRLAVAQYRQELVQRLGVLAFLLDADEVHEARAKERE